MSQIHEQADKRHDFVFLFDVRNGNPNGDPDNDNLPRTDAETGHGVVTDVCLKRKIRDYVDIVRRGDERYNIYIRKGDIAALNTKHENAYTTIGLKAGGKKPKREEQTVAEMNMRRTYFDIRSFGAVMTTGINAGQVRGPLQLTFSRSVDPVFAHDITITRVAVTKQEDMAYVEADDEGKQKSKQSEMGRKALIPYGLFVGHGFYNPFLRERHWPAGMDRPKGVSEEDVERLRAEHSFTDDDLSLFWEAMQNMFDFDRSASRGWMELRGLYVFTHDRPTGNAHAHKLFEHVKPCLKDGVDLPRSFDDYDPGVVEDGLPEGVTLTRLVG